MEPLSDPRNDRPVKSMKAPPARPLTSELLWDQGLNSSMITRHSELESFARSSKT